MFVSPFDGSCLMSRMQTKVERGACPAFGARWVIVGGDPKGGKKAEEQISKSRQKLCSITLEREGNERRAVRNGLQSMWETLTSTRRMNHESAMTAVFLYCACFMPDACK
jgi:hypothetical protein